MSRTTPRAELLRNHEVFAYRVAFYLLRQEEQAMEAVRRAMLAVAAEGEFFALSPEEREQRLKRVVIREGLALRRK